MVSKIAYLHLLAAIALIAFAPTSESLWIDESGTAMYASSESWGKFIESIRADKNSEALMPVFLTGSRIAASALGTSEWALRAQNLLWGALALYAFWRIGRLYGAPWFVWLLALHPFLWFYMDEARPYALQIAAGAWLVERLLHAKKTGNFGFAEAIIFSVAGFLLCGSSLLGAIPFGAVIAGLCWLWFRKEVRITAGAAATMAAFFTLDAILGLYYVSTIFSGSGGAKIWVLGIQNIGLCFYEWLGFSGLGPGRFTLRELGRMGLSATLAGLVPYAWSLSLLGLAYAAVIITAIRLKTSRKWPEILICIFVGSLSFLGLLGLAALVGFPFWGRHLAALLPILIAPVAILLLPGPQGSSSLPIIARTLLLIALGLSTWNIRFSPEQQKEDYRGAVAIAKAQLAEGHSVIWRADPRTARYYGLFLDDADSSGRARSAIPQGTQLEDDVDFAVLSKPDIFDPAGSLKAIATRKAWAIILTDVHGFTFYSAQKASP